VSRTARGQRKRPPSPTRSAPWRLVGLLAAAAAIAAAAIFFLRPFDSGGQAAWTRFGSQDVHSLVFVDPDARHVLFGHHGGLEESRDGGRTWSRLPVRDDAMSTSTAADGSIVIAGHEVFTASRDGGATWVSIAGDLPSLDIHGFTRDPADPSRMWAYLATGGLWETTDFGSHWTRVREDNVLFPVAVRAGSATRLLGIDVNGLVSSSDGGRSWQPLSMPPTYPMTAFAASADGMVLFAGSPDGLFRSGDGGRSWAPTAYAGSAFAVATTVDGGVVAVVSRETEFFRSDDGGATWHGPS
jgi:photosystem II stability/assembly factor-like uncharacterized protein